MYKYMLIGLVVLFGVLINATPSNACKGGDCAADEVCYQPDGSSKPGRCVKGMKNCEDSKECDDPVEQVCITDPVTEEGKCVWKHELVTTKKPPSTKAIPTRPKTTKQITPTTVVGTTSTTTKRTTTRKPTTVTTTTRKPTTVTTTTLPPTTKVQTTQPPPHTTTTEAPRTTHQPVTQNPDPTLQPVEILPPGFFRDHYPNCGPFITCIRYTAMPPVNIGR